MASNADERMLNGLWREQESHVRARQAEWYREHVNQESSCKFSLGGEVNGDVERVVGSRMYLAGPMIDKTLKLIGVGFMNKLTHSKSTGRLKIFSNNVFDNVFASVEAICIGCGVKKVIRKPGRKKSDPPSQVQFFIDSQDVADKVFSPNRFDGTYYLAKRFFVRGKGATGDIYSGMARVVVTPNTPIEFSYARSKELLTVSCFIQRYTANDLCIDSSLQLLTNSCNA